MRLIEPTSEIVEIPYSKDSYKKMIEKVGRICYHTEDKTTPTSFEKFVDTMVHKNHGSVPEHGTIYLYITDDVSAIGRTPQTRLIHRYMENKFSIVHDDGMMDIRGFYITTNYRVIVENGWEDDLKYACAPMKYHEKRVTVKFTMDRVGSQSVVRHRGADGNSFLQESTRYCNYAKDKFDGELKVSPPQWVINDENFDIVTTYNEYTDKVESFRQYCEQIAKNNVNDLTAIDWWLFGNMACEQSYLNIIRLGHTAEEARSVLPLDLNTELFCTFSITDWKHFFDLRVKGTTGRPHPDIKALCEPLYAEFVRLGYLTE